MTNLIVSHLFSKLEKHKIIISYTLFKDDSISKGSYYFFQTIIIAMHFCTITTKDINNKENIFLLIGNKQKILFGSLENE